MYVALLILSLLSATRELYAEIGETELNKISPKMNEVKINKCCEHNEILVDRKCRLAEIYNHSLWTPQFKTEDGNDAKVKYFNYVYGIPDCETTQQRAIFDLEKSEDKLNLLTDGRLHHIIHHVSSSDDNEEPIVSTFNLQDNITIPKEKHTSSFIHNQNKYCMDKFLLTYTNITGIYALVCVPQPRGQD